MDVFTEKETSSGIREPEADGHSALESQGSYLRTLPQTLKCAQGPKRTSVSKSWLCLGWARPDRDLFLPFPGFLIPLPHGSAAGLWKVSPSSCPTERGMTPAPAPAWAGLENGKPVTRCSQDPVRATLANCVLCLPLPSFAGPTSLPGRVLRVGPVGQGLHGGPGSLGWERDRHRTSENPLVRTLCPALESWGGDARGGNNSYSTLCSQDPLGAPGSVCVCLCARAFVSVRVGNVVETQTLCSVLKGLRVRAWKCKYPILGNARGSCVPSGTGGPWTWPFAPFSHPYPLPCFPLTTSQLLILPGVMPGGCRLRSRSCPLAPASQALALSTGSQLTAVSGKTSSWKNSFCREGGRGYPEAPTRCPGHTNIPWEGSKVRPRTPGWAFCQFQNLSRVSSTSAPKSSEMGLFGDRASQAPKLLTEVGKGD